MRGLAWEAIARRLGRAGELDVTALLEITDRHFSRGRDWTQSKEVTEQDEGSAEDPRTAT